jgi:hypothetical protein
MGMLCRSVTQAKSDYQEKLVDALWTTLKGDQRKYIHQADLQIFLQLCVHIIDPNVISRDGDENVDNMLIIKG